jgi:hypothetical protein
VLALHTAGLLDSIPDTLSWLLNHKAPGYLRAANLLWRLLTALILALNKLDISISLTSLATPLLPALCKLSFVSMQYVTYFNKTPATVADEKYVMEMATDYVRGWHMALLTMVAGLDLKEVGEPEVASWKQLLAGSPGLPEAACAQLAAQVQVLYNHQNSSSSRGGPRNTRESSGRSRSSTPINKGLGSSKKCGEQSENFATKFAALLLYPDHHLITSATEVAPAAVVHRGGGGEGARPRLDSCLWLPMAGEDPYGMNKRVGFLHPLWLLELALDAGWLAGPMESFSTGFPFDLDNAVGESSSSSSSGGGQEEGPLVVPIGAADQESGAASPGAGTAASSSSSSDAGCWTVSAATVMKLVLEAAILMGAAGRGQELRRVASVLSKLLLQCRAEEKEEFLKARGALLLDVVWLASKVAGGGDVEVLSMSAILEMAFCYQGE